MNKHFLRFSFLILSFPVHITYHRQKSSTARIKNGEVHLRISSLTPRAQQQDHIEDLLKKIKRSIPKQNSKKTISLIPYLKSGILKLNTGFTYQLKFKKANRKTIGFKKINHSLFILLPLKIDTQLPITNYQLLTKIEIALWKFLCKDQIKALTQKLNSFLCSESEDHYPRPWMTEKFKKLTLKTTTSRWGSCDKRSKTIMLCIKLLLVEEDLLNYVCIHELAHLKHSNHSDLFWNLVSQKLPHWKTLKKKLNQYH